MFIIALFRVFNNNGQIYRYEESSADALKIPHEIRNTFTS